MVFAVVEELVAIADVHDAPISTITPGQPNLIGNGGASGQGENTGGFTVEDGGESLAFLRCQFGEICQQLPDVRNFVARPTAFLLAVFHRIAHESDQGLVGELRLERQAGGGLGAQFVMNGQLARQGAEGFAKVFPQLGAFCDNIRANGLDAVVLAVAVLVKAVVVVVVDDLIFVLAHVLFGDAMISGRILE